MSRARRLVVSTLLFAPAMSAAAQPLALTAAQAEARAHAPEGAELEARLRGAETVFDDARRIFRRDPSITGTYGTGALTGSPDEHSATIELRFPIDISGSWTPREGAARAERDRSRYERTDGLQALDEAVAISFADLAVAQRLLARTEHVATLYAFAFEAERERLAVGQGTQLDVDVADLDGAGARAGVSKARGTVAQACGRLARLLGRDTTVDLVAEDLTEPADVPAASVLEGIVSQDPRVLAAEADARSHTLGVEVYERVMIPAPTLGVDIGWRQRDISTSAFRGPSAAGLSALWAEWEMGFSLGFPLPLFDGYREPRARALQDSFAAAARVAIVRADARAELELTWSAYHSAAEAHQALARTAEVIGRDFGLLERAMRAGSMDALTRAVALRRLEDAGRRLDVAVRDLRAARARWVRRAGVRSMK